MSRYQAEWMAPPELQRSVDETAFELIELLYADQRGWATPQRWHEIAAQLRTLAGRLELHGDRRARP